MRSKGKSKRVSIRISPELGDALLNRSLLTGKSESVIVRESLESHLLQPSHQESAYDVASRLGLIGSASDMPSDLSTNREYFEGFGSGR